MSLTAHRVIQYIILILIFCGMAGGYWYWQTRAAVKTNTSLEDTLEQGLTGYWKLDDGSGTTATDSSGNSNNGTLTNGPTWTTGQIQSAIDFDGTDDYVTIPDPSSGILDVADSTNFTLSGWFNRDTFTTDDTIIAKRNGIASTDTGYLVYVDDATDKLTFEASDGTDEYQMESSDTFTTTGWNHFVIVWNDSSSSQTKMYINGALQSTTNTGTFGNVNSLANAVAFNLGAESDGGNPFDGKLDEARIYRRVLSDDEVSRLYRITAPTGVDTGLVGYWPFDGDDISGTTAYDRSGAGNNGTLTNGPTKTIGKIGQALSFDGSNDYTRVNTNAVFNVSQITVSTWVYVRSSSINDNIVTRYDDGVALNDWRLGIGAASANAFRFGVVISNTLYSAESTLGFSLNTWHHLVGTYNGNAIRLYVDGVNTVTTVQAG